MNIQKAIPNLVTLANLFCGTLAAVYAVNNDFKMVAILVLAGIVFDFFDGFLARLLKVQSPLGKELDSLADAVTSGVVPGIVMFKLLGFDYSSPFLSSLTSLFKGSQDIQFIQYAGLMLTLGAVYRLGRFNLDTRQTTQFFGLPTPAMSSFVVSLPLILMYSDIQWITDLVSNEVVLLIITLFLTILMNVDLPLFSLKVKGFNFQENKTQYIFIAVSLVLLLFLKIVAVPVIVLWYVGLSVLVNKKKV